MFVSLCTPTEITKERTELDEKADFDGGCGWCYVTEQNDAPSSAGPGELTEAKVQVIIMRLLVGNMRNELEKGSKIKC